jgi:2-dehydro-3-deoxygluconokinase
MKKICFIGECMVELRTAEDFTIRQSFAGDVYNSAVYLKRCFPHMDSQLMSAVGKDELSRAMIKRFESEGINADLVFQHDSLVAGLYMIHTDEHGERSFTYWRSDSAARRTLDFVDEATLKHLSNVDMVFISGISLAVLAPDTRSLLWKHLDTLKSNGVKVVFDPNYRARLWASEEEAKGQFEKAFACSDIILPGVEDFAFLYDIHDTEGVLAFCEEYSIEEVVIKNGPSSVITCIGGKTQEHVITPVQTVIDTTSAGDAFNGTYLGARLQGDEASLAVKKAAIAAGEVIQHPGAIVPKISFDAVTRKINQLE